MKDNPDAVSPAERANLESRLAAEMARRPEAQEAEIVPLFKPGAICFVGSSYGGMSPSIGEVWPMAEWWISCFLDLLPYKHRLDYWKERIDCGATLLTLFVNPLDWRVVGAGIVNCEQSDEGKPIVFAPVMTFSEVGLADLSKIAEAVALMTGAQLVHLWTPQAAPIVAGYHSERCWFGQLQVAPVRPIQ
jgi:hypothetical protein